MSISIIFPFGTIHSWHLLNYEFLAPSPCHYDTQSTYQNFYCLNYNQPLTSSVLEVIYGYDFLRDELGLILADKKEKREEKENIWEWHHPQMEIWIKNLHISDTFRELIEHLKDGSSNDSLKLNSLMPYWPQHLSLGPVAGQQLERCGSFQNVPRFLRRLCGWSCCRAADLHLCEGHQTMDQKWQNRGTTCTKPGLNRVKAGA